MRVGHLFPRLYRLHSPRLWQALRQLRATHLTITEAAKHLDLSYTMVWYLIFEKRVIPALDLDPDRQGEEGKKGGKWGGRTPRYLVTAAEIRAYKRKRQALGRPRITDKRIKRALQPILQVAKVLQAYRKEHGHYPLGAELERVIGGKVGRE